MRSGVVAIVKFDVVIPAIGLLLYLKGGESELDAITRLCRYEPLAVGVAGVVIIPKLSMRIQVLLTHLCFQPPTTLYTQTHIYILLIMIIIDSPHQKWFCSLPLMLLY